jgi:hypothetical protein
VLEVVIIRLAMWVGRYQVLPAGRHKRLTADGIRAPYNSLGREKLAISKCYLAKYVNRKPDVRNHMVSYSIYVV